MSRAHLDKQQYALVFIVRPALAYTYRVVDACSKHRTLKHAVNLARTKAHARWVQHAVAAILSAQARQGREVGACAPAAEDYVSLRAWVHSDEVAMAPYPRVGVIVRLEELTPARIVAPEPHGDRRMWPCADELARDACF